MAETIFSRISRLLSGKLEDSVDQMERAGGLVVMRESIREVDRAIDDLRSDHEAVMTRRLQAARQQKMLREQIEVLNGKAQFALAEARSDLAEAAISRQIDFEREAMKLDQIQAQAREEEARLESNLASLKERKRQMDEALSAFVASRRQAASGGDGPSHQQRGVEKQVARSEEAFQRAMSDVGGVGFARADLDAINRVAEIDGLQKSAAIAERLAKLKQAARAAHNV